MIDKVAVDTATFFVLQKCTHCPEMDTRWCVKLLIIRCVIFWHNDSNMIIQKN